MRKTHFRLLTAAGSMLAAGTIALSGVVAAAASVQDRPGDRPHGVAQVSVDKKLLLGADGTVMVTARLECDPGWESSDLSVSITQADASSSGFIGTAVPCDHNWHRVQFSVPPGTGTFQPGKATVNAQFLVFNIASGDPAADHQNVTISLVAAAAA